MFWSLFKWTVTHNSVNHNGNMPDPVWKFLPYGIPQPPYYPHACMHDYNFVLGCYLCLCLQMPILSTIHFLRCWISWGANITILLNKVDFSGSGIPITMHGSTFAQNYCDRPKHSLKNVKYFHVIWQRQQITSCAHSWKASAPREACQNILSFLAVILGKLEKKI